MDDRYRLLFEPLRIGPVTAKNRFYAVPLATGHGHLQSGHRIVRLLSGDELAGATFHREQARLLDSG